MMDSTSEQTLARIIRSTRLATLGTIHNGEPNLAMVAYAFADDFSAFYIHVSRLGKHTRDMEIEPRVSLLITETDDGRPDPQTLVRVSIQGTAGTIGRALPNYENVKAKYIARFPEAEKLFSFGDFNLWGISPREARFVAGFGQAYNLAPESLLKASGSIRKTK